MATLRKRKRAAPGTARPSVALTDKDNPVLALGAPAIMTCGVIDADQGKRLIVTVRTTSATVSVALDRNEIASWVAEFVRKINAMDGKPEG